MPTRPLVIPTCTMPSPSYHISCGTCSRHEPREPRGDLVSYQSVLCLTFLNKHMNNTIVSYLLIASFFDIISYHISYFSREVNFWWGTQEAHLYSVLRPSQTELSSFLVMYIRQLHSCDAYAAISDLHMYCAFALVPYLLRHMFPPWSMTSLSV